jgi:prepilin-type processing-associated H-X9-DG protein
VRRSTERETALEERCCTYTVEHGGLALKLRPIVGRGFPDRTILFADGHVWFAEFKRPDGSGEVAAQQKAWGRLLRERGYGVYFIDRDADFHVAWDKERAKANA